MTGQMGSALGKLAGSRSEGACVCVWGGGARDVFHVCADVSTVLVALGYSYLLCFS